jgi:putative heme-binding domain-containing protein
VGIFPVNRHLQQQYGVYAGHDRGRLYRLTHRDAARPPPADLSTLDAKALARECASPLLWRRQTAERLLLERGEKTAAASLRETLGQRDAEPATIITALRSLEGLGVLGPSDPLPFIRSPAASVRIHVLQVSDRWFAREEGRALLEASLAAAAVEEDPRVLIQFALSLGEARDPRAFALLARFARERQGVRWMDAALLSSLHGRGLEMLGLLLRDPGGSTPFLSPLAQSIAARRDEGEVLSTLNLLATAKPEAQSSVLAGLARGRRNAPKPSADRFVRAALANLAGSPVPEVQAAARALEEAFAANAARVGLPLPSPDPSPPDEGIGEEAYRSFVAALAGPRDLKRGHELFLQLCSTCHRIGSEGHEVGPDLLGQLGMAEESLLREVLMPSERIRPGYETVFVQIRGGGATFGILKNDGATSVALALPGGVEQVLLRKDLQDLRRLPASLMPSYADGLKPAELAGLLAWLRSNLGPGAPGAEARKPGGGDPESKGRPPPPPRKAEKD